MSLKTFTIPLCILTLIVLGVFYIKPDIDALSEKKLLLETKKAQAANMAMLLANINALSSELDTRKESERFVKSYLPEHLDQEVVMDMLNFLAVQAGVFPDLITLQEITDNSVPEEVIDPVTGSLVASTKIKPKSYSATVQVKGDYSGIKTFFDRVAHINRFHKTKSFSLTAEDSAADTASSDTASAPVLLVGTFMMDFDYFPVKKVDSALNIPIFSRATLNTEPLDAVMTWVTSKVPPLESGNISGAGRPDPFR